MAARFLTALAAALLLVSPTVWAQSQPADPPARVGRLSAIEGTVQQKAQRLAQIIREYKAA